MYTLLLVKEMYTNIFLSEAKSEEIFPLARISIKSSRTVTTTIKDSIPDITLLSGYAVSFI